MVDLTNTIESITLVDHEIRDGSKLLDRVQVGIKRRADDWVVWYVPFLPNQKPCMVIPRSYNLTLEQAKAEAEKLGAALVSIADVSYENWKIRNA